MYNAAMNFCVQVFLWICIFSSLGYTPRSGNLFLVFSGVLIFNNQLLCGKGQGELWFVAFVDLWGVNTQIAIMTSLNYGDGKEMHSNTPFYIPSTV